MDKELKKILDEICLERKSKRQTLTSVNPHSSGNVVNMDFASLYPTQQKWWDIKWLPQKVLIRKLRIKKIFQ